MVIADPSVAPIDALAVAATEPFVPGHRYQVRVQVRTTRGQLVAVAGQELGRVRLDAAGAAVLEDAPGAPLAWQPARWTLLRQAQLVAAGWCLTTAAGRGALDRPPGQDETLLVEAHGRRARLEAGELARP